MPSKGVLCFSYITTPNTSIEFTTPKQSTTRRELQTFQQDHLEVESSNISHLTYTGQFRFTVYRDKDGSRELTSQWVDINTVTGKLESGSMQNMDQTPSIFIDDMVIIYGFYEAGPGVAGLPKQHHCYVYVTRDLSNWMSSLIPLNSELETRPFCKMVLPSSHDVGMNRMKTCLVLLQNCGSKIIKEVLGRELPQALVIFNKLSDTAVNSIAPDIIRALAITQKDSLDTILKIGARYFEFRPAKCHRQMQRVSPLEDTFYFQHSAIPGMPYKYFLQCIVNFLTSHGDEIIVIHNRWDGVPADCPRPSEEELNNILINILTNQNLQIGDQTDMLDKSLRDLRAEDKRLIILHNASQTSNYDDVANATLTGDSMVTKLKEMARNPPPYHPITLLQCQATPTNIRDVTIASVLNSYTSNSPLLATKPLCDAKMLPLLARDEECKSNLVMRDEAGLVVLVNDFIEGATVDVAVELCGERLRAC